MIALQVLGGFTRLPRLALLAQTAPVDTRIPVPKVDWLAVGPEVALIGAAMILVLMAALNRGRRDLLDLIQSSSGIMTVTAGSPLSPGPHTAFSRTSGGVLSLLALRT